QRAEEVDERVDECADCPIPAENEASGNSECDTAEHTKKYATCGHEDVQRQTAAHQFDEARGHLVRGRHEGRIDEAAVVDAVPACQQDKPGGKDESRSTHVSSKCFCSLWLKHPKRTMYRMFD